MPQRTGNGADDIRAASNAPSSLTKHVWQLRRERHLNAVRRILVRRQDDWRDEHLEIRERLIYEGGIAEHRLHVRDYPVIDHGRIGFLRILLRNAPLDV